MASATFVSHTTFGASPSSNGAFSSMSNFSAPRSGFTLNNLDSAPRLLVRLPAPRMPRDPTDPSAPTRARNNPLRNKWKSFVNFFALPIRQYYLEPPGESYRSELRARRGYPWSDDDGLDNLRCWPCPTYTGEAGEDEMVLFKAQEEAQAAAAAAEAAAQQQQSQIEHPNPDDASRTAAEQEVQNLQHEADLHDVLETVQTRSEDGLDSDVEEQNGLWPQTPPNVPLGFQTPDIPAEPSPRYEVSDPMATVHVGAATSVSRLRSSSNSLLPSVGQMQHRSAQTPVFSDGAAMARYSSTPLSPSGSAFASTSSSRSSFVSRRLRASSTASGLSTTPTVGGRAISEPLTWTLVRSQYSYPKRGLTAQQLSFLSSVESLGRFGVPHSPNLQVGTPNIDSPAYHDTGSDYGFPTTPAPLSSSASPSVPADRLEG